MAFSSTFIYLNKDEKKKLIADKETIISRVKYIPQPKSSILHGTGNKSLWDKIARVWVFGDTDDYIEKMKGEGPRGTEYIYGPNKDTCIVTGQRWYEFHNLENTYNGHHTNGRKNAIRFRVTNFIISALQPTFNNPISVDVIYSITIKLIENDTATRTA